jgi:hypothetical protein
MQNLFKILITGLIFVSLNFSTAEAQLMIDHPCYDIDPTKRDGHACWSKGEHPSENVVKLNTSNAELEYELSAARDALATSSERISTLELELSAARDALTTSERISTSQECAFKFEKGDGMAPHIARERICKDIIDRFEKKSREASCWAAGHRDCE